MNILRLIFVLILLGNISGCVTNKYLDSLDEEKKIQTIYLENYVLGELSYDHVTLCFYDGDGYTDSDIIEDLEGYLYTITIPLNTEHDSSNHSSYYKIKNNDIENGCKITSVESNISLFKGYHRPPYLNTWSKFNKMHKGESLFIPAERYIDKPLRIDMSDLSTNVLYLSRNNDERQSIVLLPQSHFVKEDCNVCYLAVPFTFTVDVITYPLQLLGDGIEMFLSSLIGLH